MYDACCRFEFTVLGFLDSNLFGKFCREELPELLACSIKEGGDTRWSEIYGMLCWTLNQKEIAKGLLGDPEVMKCLKRGSETRKVLKAFAKERHNKWCIRMDYEPPGKFLESFVCEHTTEGYKRYLM